MDEVLQSQTVYSNVSKATVAKSSDLMKAFGTDDHSQICLEVSCALVILLAAFITYNNNVHLVAFALKNNIDLVCSSFSLMRETETLKNLAVK